MKKIFLFLIVAVFSLSNCKQALKDAAIAKMIVLNDSLESDTKNRIAYNDDTILELSSKYKNSLDPLIDSVFYNKAQQIRTLNKKMIRYIGDLKEDLIMEVEGSNQDTIKLSSMKNADNIDIPSYYLLNNNKERAEPGTKVYELIEEINKYKKDIIATIDSKITDLMLAPNIEEEYYSESEEYPVRWEISKFYHQPTASIFCSLSQLQLEIAKNESKNIGILFNVIQKSKGITK